jgi:hypothetical protein
METDELRQLLGEILLAAGIAQQAHARAKRTTDSLEKLGFIETAAGQVTVIVHATQRACARAKQTSDEITVDDPQFRIPALAT